MKSLFEGLVRLGDALRPLVLLALRVVIGVGFFYAGKGKFGNLDGVVEYFRDLGIPAPQLQAPFIAGLELAGGIALVAGLGTRVFALLLSCTMVVALLTEHRNELGLVLSDFTEVAPLPFLLPLLVLLAFGAGGISVDAFLGGSGAAPAKSKPAS
jgi:putative oxidoreductase